MKKSLSLFILLITILAGCQSSPFGSHTIIDWVDFIKWNGIEYDGIYSGVLADETYIGKKIGEVKFKVADNVSDPEYKIKNGDAAFHEKGTDIYAVKGYPHLLAVKSSRNINGYSLYYSRDDETFQWHFNNMPLDKVDRVEVFQEQSPEGTRKLTEITNPEQIKNFLQILQNGKKSPDFQPDTNEKDPFYYQMVFYTGDPVAYMFNMQFDGKTYYWFPDETAILSNEIQAFFPSN